MPKRASARGISGQRSRIGATDARARRALRPDLESLESRQLLAAVSEFPLRVMGGPSGYVALGPDKAIWATLASNNIGQLNTSTGVVNQYPIPSPNSAPGAIIKGPDNKLWFIEAATNQFGVVNPSTGVVTEVPVLADGASQIQDLAAGADGNIWFTEFKTNKVGEINPATHIVQEFAIPTANSEPYDIVTGPDGNLWFTESGSNKIGMINPATHAIVDFAIPSTGNDQAQGIAVGSDGNLWFTETAANAIGKINPTTHAFTTYTTGLTAKAGLSEITAGPNGSLWFTEAGISFIGTIAPGTGAIKQYSDAGFNSAGLLGIASGSDGNLYFGTGGVGKITPTGTITTIKVPVSYSGNLGNGQTGTAVSIVAGSDGNLWFLDAPPVGGGLTAAQIGLVGPKSQLSAEFTLQNDELYQPVQITSDPADGSLWFTEYSIFGAQHLPDTIGRIDPTTRAITYVNVPTSGAGVRGLTYDSSNGSFWFTESGANTIGSLNPTTDAVADKFLTLPSGANPQQIVADSSGKLWFTENGIGKIGVYDPSNGNVAQISLGSATSNPQGITLGPDGNIWFVEVGASKIGVINPQTKALIDQTAAPATGQISTGPDGALWFTEASSLGRITTSTYNVTSIATPNTTPSAVTNGPDGNLWFTGQGNTTIPNITGTVDLAPAATAASLAITTQPPAAVTASKGFGLVVSVMSASGNLDNYYNGPVTIALNPVGSTLGGTLTATAVNGVAAFPGLTLDTAGTGYTITASGTGLAPATSSPFNVTLGATHLVVTAGPQGSVPAGTPFTVTAAAEDGSGNIDASFDGTLTVAIGNNPGISTLSGTTILGANSGIVTFGGLALNNPGADYTLIVSDPSSGLMAGSTAGFNVSPPPATHLVVTAQPPLGVVAGASFSLTISAENGMNQVDTGDNAPVSLSLLGGLGATLGGVVSENFNAGVAVFSGLSINLIGSNYKILPASGTLTSTPSNAISVISASASTFSISPVNGGNPIIGVPFPVDVKALDPFGNLANGYSGTVHLSSTDPTFVPPGDYTFLPIDNGSHIFQVTLGTLGAQGVTVTDDANATIKATTSVTVVASTPTTTTLTVSPSSSVIGQAVTLKATVTQDVGTGTVTFLDGSNVLGVMPLTATGATWTVSTLALGAHSLSARYGGSADSTLAGSTSAVKAFQVSPATTSALASASTSSAILGRPLILTATIRRIAPGSGAPGGMVTFLDGTTLLQSVMLDPTGHATLSVSNLSLGTHAISVSYSGDPNDVLSKSAAIQVHVGDQAGDFDGDGKADLAVYGKVPGTNLFGFTILMSSSGFSTSQEVVWDNQGFGFGNASSIPVVGDYFGDGKAAHAIFTPDGRGFMLFQAISSVNPARAMSVSFGLATDVPVVADVDGDGKADFGVYGPDPNLGYRFDFLLSSKGFDPKQPLIFNNYGFGYGLPGASPVVADFDGSGHVGFGVYIPSGTTGTFTYTNVTIPTGTTGPIVNPPASYYFARIYGFSNDVPMAVDYDGDGKADLALYGLDPRTGRYRYDLLTSSTNFSIAQHVYFDNAGLGYGYSGSTPVMADYEGNGHADFAVFQPDGNGSAEYVFQDVGVGHGVVYDFAPMADLPVTAPLFLLARKVRGH
jgi:streptogramin lyase